MDKAGVIKVLDKYLNDYLSTQEDIEAFGYARECVENGIEWHPYPEEKPKTSGRYLCVCQDETLTFGKFRIDSWEVLDARYGYIPYWGVKWWAELPDTPVYRRENAE